MIENQHQDNQNNLIPELSPSLHQESHSDLATTMQAVFFCGNPTGACGVLHRGGGGHGVFTTDTDAVEEEGPGIADHPAVEV